jgi:hypothetical protein
MTSFRALIDLLEFKDTGGTGQKPPTPPRSRSPWGDGGPEDFDEYTIFWVRGDVVVRCNRGSPEEDFLERADALMNHDVLRTIPDVTDLEDPRLWSAALEGGFALVHIEFHELTSHANAQNHDVRDIRRYMKDATETSGYNIDVVAGSPETAQNAARKIVQKGGGDLPAMIDVTVIASGMAPQTQKITGPEVRSYLG